MTPLPTESLGVLGSLPRQGQESSPGDRPASHPSCTRHGAVHGTLAKAPARSTLVTALPALGQPGRSSEAPGGQPRAGWTERRHKLVTERCSANEETGSLFTPAALVQDSQGQQQTNP